MYPIRCGEGQGGKGSVSGAGVVRVTYAPAGEEQRIPTPRHQITHSTMTIMLTVAHKLQII